MGSSPAGRPVRARKTSSRLGRCSSTAAIGSPWASRRRIASADAAGRPRRRGSRRPPCPRAAARPRPSRPAPPRHRRRLGIGDADAEHVSSDRRLQLGGVPCGDDPPVVDEGDPLGQAIGLLEVLGGQQHRRALPVELLDDAPQLLAGARVKPGGRLVEQHAPAAVRSGPRRGRAAGACRPSTSRRDGRRPRPARSARAPRSRAGAPRRPAAGTG